MKEKKELSNVHPNEFKRFIGQKLGIDPKTIKVGYKFRDDLGLRNIELLEITHQAEITFKTGRLNGIRKVETIRDLLKIINQNTTKNHDNNERN